MLGFNCFVFHIPALDAQNNCSENPLGMESSSIPDLDLQVSNTKNGFGKKLGRLGREPKAWCSNNNGEGYFQINLQYIHQICAVATQGLKDGNSFLKKYILKLSADGNTWDEYQREDDEKVRLKLVAVFLRHKVNLKLKEATLS